MANHAAAQTPALSRPRSLPSDPDATPTANPSQLHHEQPAGSDLAEGRVVAKRASGEVMEFANSTDAWLWLDQEYAID